MKRIYFDYAASTPVEPRVEKAMRPYFFQKFGNTSSLHRFGQEALAAVDLSREVIASALGANFREIIFTGSATEANNLALRGPVKEFRIQNLGYRKPLNSKSYILNPRIVVSAIEHESILETARDLEQCGAEIVYLPVNRQGVIDLKKLKKSLNERTILVSVMYANNEIGTIEPISAIAKLVQEFRKQKIENRNSRFYFLDSRFPLFHTDAVQAFQFLDCDVKNLGVDLLTLSAHKIYGPKGVGGLYVRQQIANSKSQIANNSNKKSYSPFAIGHLPLLAPLTTGGGQEFGLRSGTENTPAIVGFAKAVELISNSRELESKRIRKLHDYFWQEIRKVFPGAEINGATTKSKEQMTNSLNKGVYSPFAIGHLPNILNIYFPGYKSEELLAKLDLAGIAVSAGSACTSRSPLPSYVIRSLGWNEKRMRGSLRFSFGRPTTKSEIDKALKIIKNILL